MTLNTFRSPTPLTHIHTFLLSWAASSFFWISASDGFWRGGVVALSSGAPSKVGGFRMTSKAWPLARLLSSITSMSRMLQRFKSTTPAVAERGWGGEMKISRGYYGFVWLTLLLGFTLNYCFASSSNTDRLSSATFKTLVFTGALTRAPSAWDSDFYDSLMGWLINSTSQNLMIYSRLIINVFPFRDSSASKGSACSFLGKYFVLFTFHIILWFHLLGWPTKSSLSIVFPAVAHRQVEPVCSPFSVFSRTPLLPVLRDKGDFVLLTFLLVGRRLSGLGKDAGAEERHQGEVSHLLPVSWNVQREKM